MSSDRLDRAVDIADAALPRGKGHAVDQYPVRRTQLDHVSDNAHDEETDTDGL